MGATEFTEKGKGAYPMRRATYGRYTCPESFAVLTFSCPRDGFATCPNCGRRLKVRRHPRCASFVFPNHHVPADLDRIARAEV